MKLLRFSLLSAALLVAPHAAHGADALFAQLAVESDHVFRYEPFQVFITVRGTVRPRIPDTSAVKDFDVALLGHRSRDSQGETIFYYRFTPRRLGKLGIPPIPVRGGTSSTKTARAVIRVEAAPPVAGAALEMRLDPPSAYVGQSVEVLVRFISPAPVRAMELTLPFARDSRVDATLINRGIAVPLPAGFLRLRVNDRPAIAEERLLEKGSELEYRAVIRPLKWGRIRFDPATLRTSGDTGRLLVRSEPVDLEVQQLPAGAPPSYTGLIGRHELLAEVQPRRATLGEPLELVLTLSGGAYLEDAESPDPTPALGGEFRVYGQRESVDAGAKQVRYKIRPNRSGDVTIPAIDYAYFDPETGRYVTHNTQPIRVRIDEPAITASLSPPAPAPVEPAFVPEIAIDVRGPPQAADRSLAEWAPAILALAALALMFAIVRKRAGKNPQAPAAPRAPGTIPPEP